MEYRIAGRSGDSLFDALLEAGLPVESPCGGAGTCGKCRIRVLSRDLGEPEAGAVRFPLPGMTGQNADDPSIEMPAPREAVWRDVLSCRIRFIRDGEAIVDVSEKRMHIVEHSEFALPPGDPALHLTEARLPMPQLENAGSELARLSAIVGGETGNLHSDSASNSGTTARLSLDLTRTLASILDPDKDESRSLRLMLQEGGHVSFAQAGQGVPLAAAVDIGTTTVAVRLLDTETDAILASGAKANIQKWAGADVIARIGACSRPDAFSRLSAGIAGQIGKLILSLVAEEGRNPEDVKRIVIAGNPTMLHILAGVDPAGIARAPFVPVFSSAFDLSAKESPLGDIFGADTRTILIPGVSAYVGADLVAGALACGLAAGGSTEVSTGDFAEGSAREPALLLDLGTNGEIMLFAGGKAWCSSAAAGPAFEGASIRFGSPSVPGAIDHVSLVGNRIVTTVIGGGSASGICGSGILDAVAVLLESGALDETGRIDPDLPQGERLEAGRIVRFEEKPAVLLDSEAGILITQDDIRQVQLAKAAVTAGIGILLSQAGITAREVKTIYLAGGFGSRLDPASALRIGLLDGDFAGRVRAVGNSSLAGATIVALRAGALGTCARVARSCRAIELSGRGDFVAAFSEAMFFPEDGNSLW